MRERHQMASRPFASVAVALDAGGKQAEILLGNVESFMTTLFDVKPATHEIQPLAQPRNKCMRCWRSAVGSCQNSQLGGVALP
ncbi:hypothetical protein DPEC_G00371220 [Dallia pectoralis]|nr:hypothetical protein DPEC_G00371220 [Dallia pectoralis]